MTNLMNSLSPTAMHSLGWALLHFLWQGTALAALAAGAMALCRRAAVRYAIGVGALLLMVLAPLVTFVSYSQPSYSQMFYSQPFYPQSFNSQGHSGVADTAKSSPLAAVAWPTARGRAAASGSTLPFFHRAHRPLLLRCSYRGWWRPGCSASHSSAFVPPVDFSCSSANAADNPPS